jgi:hypothetical protein
MIELPEPPRLCWPTTAVRTSYLVGEQADCLLRGTPTDWLSAASADFDGFVAERRGVLTRWDVPSTLFWYVSGEFYLGTLVIRHRLTPELAEVGGHIGYHVVRPGVGRAMPPGCSLPVWSSAGRWGSTQCC